MHIAISINPSVLNLMMENIRQSVSNTVAVNGATLNNLSFSLQEGAIHIAGNPIEQREQLIFS